MRPARPTGRSEEHFDRALRSLAGGIGSAARGPGAGYAPSPIFVDSAAGSHVKDADGNEYIDYLLALGPLIFGHRPPKVTEFVVAALNRLGSMPGLCHDLEAEAAELVQSMVPNAELVRFSSSGTEAVAMALRLARALTHRPLILKFEGHFHGWSDSIYWSVRPPVDEAGPEDNPKPVPGAPGLPAFVAEGLLILPWNRPEMVAKLFSQHGHNIAAVITEPLMGNCGCIEPEAGFLTFLREISARHGALLIFDEVITGFRIGRGGAQAVYDVTPDLATYAKALGAGFPVSAVTGRRDVMKLVEKGSLPYLGTYNTSPLVMAAVVATLKELSTPAFFEELNTKGLRLAHGLRDQFHAAGIPLTVCGVGSVFQIWFSDRAPRSYREAVRLARPDFYRRFHQAMLDRGVLFHPNQYEHFFISAAHSGADIDRTLEAAQESIRATQGHFSA